MLGALIVVALPRRMVLAAASVVATTGASGVSAAPPASAVHWAIVGLGDVTAVKSGPPFWKCDGAQLVAAMRRTPGAAAAWVDAHVPGGTATCAAYDDLDALLAHPGLDAVYVATPPGSHAAIAMRVAAAGKHCYVEKPCGRSAREAEAMSRAFAARGLCLFPAYVSRAFPRTEAVRSLLAAGAVGERVTAVEYTLRGAGGARGLDVAGALPWRLDAAQSGGGLVLDVGCHVVDRIDFWLGPLLDVAGEAANHASPWQAVEDRVELCATIGAAAWAAVPCEGARVAMSWDFAPEAGSAEPLDRLVIQGTAGSIEMMAMSASAAVEVRDAAGTCVRRLDFEQPEHTAQALVQAATDELRGVVDVDGAHVMCPSRADNAVRTAAALDAALSSYYKGRDDEFWTRPDTWPGNPQRRATSEE